MKVIDPGHRYSLKNLDASFSDPWAQQLYFVKREGDKYPGNVGHYCGTTMQEILRALIDRAMYVDNQIPCWQTKLATLLMHTSIWLFEHRAAKRHHTKVPRFMDVVFTKTCDQCGHVICNHKQVRQ